METSAKRKVERIRQIVKLKQVMRRWRALSLLRRPASTTPPPGHLAVYVGAERRRFVIPTRYLNLPVFGSLLDRAEDEFGFQSQGALALPCEPDSFASLLDLLRRNEPLYGNLSLDHCKSVREDPPSSSSAYSAASPLLQRA